MLSHCSNIIAPCYCYSLCWYFCTMYCCWNLGVLETFVTFLVFWIIVFPFVFLSLMCKFCCCVCLLICSLYVLCLYICCILILIRMFVSIIKCKIYNTHFGHLHMKLALHFTLTHSFCTIIKGGKSEWFFIYFHTP